MSWRWQRIGGRDGRKRRRTAKNFEGRMTGEEDGGSAEFFLCLRVELAEDRRPWRKDEDGTYFVLQSKRYVSNVTFITLQI